MSVIETLDGPVDIEATEQLRREVEDALSFWYRHRRHPYRSLAGSWRFMITPSDFRYVDGSRFWRLTREQAEAALRTLWPADEAEFLALMKLWYPDQDLT